MFERQNKQDKWKHFERIRIKIQDRDGFTLTNNIAPQNARAKFRSGFVMDAFDGNDKPLFLIVQTAELVFDLFVTLAHKMFSTGLGCRKYDLKAILQTHSRSDSLTPECHGITKYTTTENHLGRIDLEIFLSHLHDFEKLITHDSNLGIKIYSAKTKAYVCLDTHKHIVVNSNNFYTMEHVEMFLLNEGLRELQVEDLAIICSMLHVHRPGYEFEGQYQALLREFGDEEYQQQ